MILPIYVYGQPVLREVAQDITAEYPNLKELIQNMFDTMEHADGIGLAAPQVGLPIRLVVVDLDVLSEDHPEFANFRKVFINPYIIEVDGDDVTMGEGCLSLPGVGEDVTRPDVIHVEYYDENFEKHTERVEGYLARVMQHEFDHLDGVMFIDHISPLRKQMIRNKLMKLVKGTARTHYKIKSVNAKLK
ncbi:peptide deformylase [Bacteroides propionicifaciens]|uniref:peptide deformylase n=1 Tax=Bacteroides propionicifaciens TaxID=392838 RepID=UPI00037304D9|nr:peptide deformylase [Bacteroides propionicifaciens]